MKTRGWGKEGVGRGGVGEEGGGGWGSDSGGEWEDRGGVMAASLLHTHTYTLRFGRTEPPCAFSFIAISHS